MTSWRVIIDDAPECDTQRAVLVGLARGLARRPGVRVLLTSDLGPLRPWDDVSPESAHRLAVRLLSLEPLAGTCTLFLPGHVVPGPPGDFGELPGPLATERFTDVGDLDLFAADNASAAARALPACDGSYEARSRHAGFLATPLPAWVTAGGLRSEPCFTRRPWLSAHAPARVAWLAALGEALWEGRLTVAQVEDDARHGRVRPSLPEEARHLQAGAPAAGLPWPDLTLDAIYRVPACRVPAARLALLAALEAQARPAVPSRRLSPRRLAGAVARRLRAWPRRLGQGALSLARAACLRPLALLLRAAGAPRP